MRRVREGGDSKLTMKQHKLYNILIMILIGEYFDTNLDNSKHKANYNSTYVIGCIINYKSIIKVAGSTDCGHSCKIRKYSRNVGVLSEASS